MHELQKLLIKRLVENNGLNYATLTSGHDQEDNILYHLNKLIQEGEVIKTANLYYLTPKGIRERGRFDLESLREFDVKSLFFGFVCKYEDRFLLKSHPSAEKDFYSLPSGKPEFGESFEASIISVFEGLTGVRLDQSRFEYDSLHLKRIMATNGEVIFDDAFVAFDVNLEEFEIKFLRLAKDLDWYNKEEIEKLQSCWPEIDICIVRNNWKLFNSYDIVCDYVAGQVNY